MKQEQFKEVIEKQLELISNTLLIKSAEYATEDKLHNFRVLAQLQNITMEQALAGMLSKHTVSIYDMIASGNRYGVEKWDEKINDHIVYLLLLRAIIEEKLTNEYVVETDKGPLAVNNPTYSRFDEEMKYRQFFRANSQLYPEFLNKKFNIPDDEQKSRLMAEVHEEYMRWSRTKINPIDDRMDNPTKDELSTIHYHRLFPDRLYVEYPVILEKIEFAISKLSEGLPASQKICRVIDNGSIIIVNVDPYYRIVYERDNCDNDGQATWVKQPLTQSNGILKLAEDIGATLRAKVRAGR